MVWAFTHNFLTFYIDDERLQQYYGIETEYYDEDQDEYVEIGDFEEAFYMHMGYSIDDWITHLQEQYENGNDEPARLEIVMSAEGEYPDPDRRKEQDPLCGLCGTRQGRTRIVAVHYADGPE